MADQYAVGTTWNTAASWASTGGGSDETGPPTVDDNAIFDAGSQDMTVDVAAAVQTLNMDGFSGTLTVSNDLDVVSFVTLGGTINAGGNTIYCGGSVNILAWTVFTNAGTSTLYFESWGWDWTLTVADGAALTLPKITVNNSSATSLTLASALTCAGFTMTNTAGVKFNDGNFAVNVAGDISIGASCTRSGAGTWTQTANGTLSNDTVANRFALVVSAVSTLALRVAISSLAGGGSVVMNGKDLYLVPGGDDFWTFTGAMAGAGNVLLTERTANTYNTAVVNTGSVNTVINGFTNDMSWTFLSDLVTTGTLLVKNGTAGKRATVAVGGALTAGAITLGSAAAEAEVNSLGTLTLSGAGPHTIASIVAAGAGTTHGLNLGTSTITLSGTIDATGIVVTNTSARINEASGGTAVVLDLIDNSDMTASPIIAAAEVDIGTDNNAGAVVNIVYDSSTPMRMLMGVGT